MIFYLIQKVILGRKKGEKNINSEENTQSSIRLDQITPSFIGKDIIIILNTQGGGIVPSCLLKLLIHVKGSPNDTMI